MTEIHKQLKESIQELEQIRNIRQHTADLQTRLAAEEKALSMMEIQLDKEQRDVETLEREGLTTMFHKFLGDREERLEKEREEYLRASLRFNELYKSVQLIRYELDLLSKKTRDEESVVRRIDSLIAHRGEELMRLDVVAAYELRGINQHTDKLNKYAVEVEEAFTAGAQALELVRKTERYLYEAQQLGQRDIWGSSRHHGTGHLKHQAIDHAKEMAHQAKHALIRFGNELKDVFRNLEVEFKMEIDDFKRFADIFFDNLITDWMVQQKINTSLANVSSTRQYVEYLMDQLNQERGIVKDKLESLEHQRTKVILSAES